VYSVLYALPTMLLMPPATIKTANQSKVTLPR
jgi:hypothetical protein